MFYLALTCSLACRDFRGVDISIIFENSCRFKAALRFCIKLRQISLTYSITWKLIFNYAFNNIVREKLLLLFLFAYEGK